MDVNLDQNCFPRSERNIAVDDFANDIVDWGNKHTYLPTQNYKAIVRRDSNELISIVRSSYKVIPNAHIINKLLQFLASTGENFRIDSSHSFVQNSRMRLQVTFPELVLEHSESDINLSLFVGNSYNRSTGLKYYFGAIRMIRESAVLGLFFIPAFLDSAVPNFILVYQASGRQVGKIKSLSQCLARLRPSFRTFSRIYASPERPHSDSQAARI